MMKKTVSGPAGEFEFTPELGKRLKQLRVRAGLTQVQLAEQMGRKGKGGHFVVGRLERAKVSRPSLGLVADYLRACRASFDDISDILNEYTRRPRVAEEKGRAAVRAMTENLPQKIAQKVERYDTKIAVDRRFSDKLPEQPDKRLLKAQRLAASWLVRQRLEDRLHEVLNKLGTAGRGPERKSLADYGRKVFGVLRRTRGKEDERRQALLEARQAAEKERTTEPGRLEHIEHKVKELFTILEQKGDLDRLPTAREAERLAGLPPGRRVRTDEKMHRVNVEAAAARKQMERFTFLDRTRDEARKLLAELGVPEDQRPRYLPVVAQFYHIADHTKAGSEQRQKMVDEFLAQMREKGCNPELVLRVGDLTLERYEQSRRAPPSASESETSE